MKIIEDLILYGPNRRSEKTLIELWLEFSEDESQLLRATLPELQARLVTVLEQHEVSIPLDHPLRQPLIATPTENYTLLIAGIMLALQQHAGHRVQFVSLFPVPGERTTCVAVEYENDETGDAARDLAFHLLGELEPGIKQSEVKIEGYRGFKAHFEEFVTKARAGVLPQDAQLIIEVAARLDIPCVKLEREPYVGLKGSFRVRPNGLLKLGHACHQQVLDGSFCIQRNESLLPMLTNRQEIHRQLFRLGVPVTREGSEFQDCITSRRAVRAAEQMGYPVVVKPGNAARSIGDSGLALNRGNALAVRQAAEQCLRTSRGVIVETQVPGDTFKILVSNFEVIAVVLLVDGVASADVSAQAHPSTLDLAKRVARKLQSGLMTLTLVSSDITQAPGEVGKIVSMDIAPELDRFLGSNGAFHSIHEKSIEGLLRFLFPEGVASRIPLLTVTGTNGKTTICTMIAKIMQTAGYLTGRAGSTGLFIDEECLKEDDFSGGSGHHLVLESSSVDCAVLEAARGAASGMGFMYDWADIAVCSNVTADHLYERGIETVEEMADLKLHIMQRARHAVVLNADDLLSAGMLPDLGGRKAWMVSARQAFDDLVEKFGEQTSYVIVEPEKEADWICIYDDGNRIPLMTVNQIPATYDGRALFNVSNAMQAIAACYQQGVGTDIIRSSLGAFSSDFETNPGRMNFFHGLPFTVLLDYAHNEDGHRQLQSFVETLDVPGRRIIALAVAGRLTDNEIIGLAGQLAGTYDFFIHRNYSELHGRRPDEIAALVRQGLINAGVPESRFLDLPGDWDTDKVLAQCRPGDLLVATSSYKYRQEDWDSLRRYREKLPA